uniref:Sushi, von Willebrand factor type A, EGF and pentraxin domain-containing protein 1 n=1 Tax=Biomphalaria glabrata TaxID=6526 RepID=A0A2C9JCP8_BIOGL
MARLMSRCVISILCLFEFSKISSAFDTVEIDAENIEQGRQLLLDFYSNYTSFSTPLTNPVDLVFVLDRSASVTRAGWGSMVRFVHNLLEHFTVDAHNTRVAIITYGTTASVDIDGIRAGDYNKCALVARLQKHLSKKVPSGYSATHDAIMKAKEVVVDSRKEAKKAVIVITDGRSNIGPPPVRASVQLRSLVWDTEWDTLNNGPQLQIYAFGIKDAYMPEVRTIASPLPNHTFYIPSFQTFSELARSLHDDSQSENWQVLGDKGYCQQEVGCSEHAYCACGTRSGLYLCVCKDGYHGDGTSCAACPRGTYKNRISPVRCFPCPANSTTLYEGATDPLQCVCEAPLYQESSGSPCHVRFCIPLPPITHGQTFHVPGRVVDEVSPTGVACTNTPDTSCHYRCDDGYRLNGHPGLICNPNGTWEGSVPECEIVNCSTLEFHHQDVHNGDVQYLNKTTTYGSILQVHCHEGYRAFGDWERTCTLHGTWSGTRTWCVENKCPALQVTPGLIITPVICGQSALTPGSVCQFICEKGYSLIGPNNVTCNDKGAWNGASQTECIDIEAPEIVCPEDITTPITEANYALVHLKVSSLRVTDNSNEFTVEVVGGVNESVRLTAGVHQFKYIARDKAGKEGHCFQTITVVDSVFRLVKCPEQNISIHMNQHLAEANWPEVVFADHNNLTVEHACAPANNSLLPPGKYTVQCTPAAHTISKVMCEFQVLLYQPQCVVPKAPLHGSLTCSPTQTSLLTCQVKCNDNYDFHSLPQSHYICDLQGVWNLKIPNLFWPDCTRKFLPGRALLRGQARFFYYRGRCEDTRTQIAQTFTDFLQTHSWNVCGQELCSIEEVKVHCGSESKRKKREEDIFLGSLKLANANLSHRRQIRESKMMSSANKTGGIDGVGIISRKLSNDAQGNSTDIYRELFRIPDEETKKTQKDNPDDIEKSAGKSFGKPGFGGGEILQEQDETSTQVFTLNKRQENSEDQFGFLDRSGAGPYGDDVLEEADSMYDVDRLTNMTQSGLLDGYNSTISDMNPDDVTWLQGSDGKEKVTITFQIISKVPPGHPVTTNAQSDMVQHLYDVSDTLTSAWQALNLTVPTNATGHIGNHTFENSTFGILSDIHQMSMDEPLIQSCPEGFVSHSEIHGSTLTCMACPRGTYHDRVLDICDVCPDHEYQPEEAQLTCLSCPDDTYTPHRGADNISLCLASCKPGEYSINGLVPCIPCPRHTFISMSQSKTCLPCLHNRKTLQIGSTSPSQCIDLCGPGNFSDTGLVPCQPCPKGSYSPDLGAITCFLCDEGQSTLGLGSVDKSSCIEWDPCLETSLVCENNGTCKKNSLIAVCECPSGFTGDWCEVNIEDCWESLCHNEATCVDGVNSFTCVCTPGHTGRYCEVGIDECLSSPCQNGGSCLDKINDYQCFCPTGYTGKQCNVTIPPCTKEICVHGTCQTMAVDDIRCVCNSGYAGPSCNVTYDLCSSHPCVHAYDCLDSPGNYTCSCRPGYTGRLCDVAINHCSPSPCLPHSACISLTSSYYCKCPGGWSGKHCDNETTADFDLIFNPSSLEVHYVVIPSSFMPTLQAFTLSTWLRPGLMSAFATIVTFILPQHGSVDKNDDSDYEVVFALQHTDKLIVRLYGESFFTNASLPPSVWTHLCFIWSSATGRWSVSVNGSLVSSDRVTAPFRPIPAQVITVIGEPES